MISKMNPDRTITVGDIGTPVYAYWFKKNKAKQQQQKTYESG